MATPPEVAITRICISGRTVTGICVMMLSHCGVSPTLSVRTRLLLGLSSIGFHLRGKQLVKKQCCTLLVFSFVLPGELFITHTCNKRNHKRQTKCLLKPKLQVDSSRLGRRQILKPAESQHVKQNKPSTCQLFIRSKHSLSIEQSSNNVQIHPTEA